MKSFRHVCGKVDWSHSGEIKQEREIVETDR